MFRRRLLGALIGAMGGLVSLSAIAGVPMPTGADVVPPAGFIGFCVKHLAECSGAAKETAVVELTEERERQLDAVQTEINHAIEPREDPAHLWDYPTNGQGDCSKFALAKRRQLIDLGWPREALLLTTAITERGEGHLVLVARTSQGDLVLDNRVATVVDWERLPYRWVSRQSEKRPTEWVSIRG